MVGVEHLRNLNDAISLLVMLENSLPNLPQANAAAVHDLAWRGVQLTVAHCRTLLQDTSDQLTQAFYQSELPGHDGHSSSSGRPSLASRIKRMPL